MAFHSGVWAVFVCHIAFNFGAYYMTNWNPTYYNEVLGVSSSDAKLHLSMPHVTNLVSKSINPALVKATDRPLLLLLLDRRPPPPTSPSLPPAPPPPSSPRTTPPPPTW